MEKEKTKTRRATPAPAQPKRRVRSLTLTVRWADEPPTLGEVVEDLRAAADRLASRHPGARGAGHEA